MGSSQSAPQNSGTQAGGRTHLITGLAAVCATDLQVVELIISISRKRRSFLVSLLQIALVGSTSGFVIGMVYDRQFGQQYMHHLLATKH